MGQLWVNTSVTPNTLSQYIPATDTWDVIATLVDGPEDLNCEAYSTHNAYLGLYSGSYYYSKGDVVSYQGKKWWALRANQGSTPEENADWTLLTSTGESGKSLFDISFYQVALSAPTQNPVGSFTRDMVTGVTAADAGFQLNGWAVNPPAAVLGQTLWRVTNTVEVTAGMASSGSIAWIPKTPTAMSASGVSANFTVGTVTKGDNPSVTKTGTAGDFTLDFVLPKGDPGAAERYDILGGTTYIDCNHITGVPVLEFLIFSLLKSLGTSTSDVTSVVWSAYSMSQYGYAGNAIPVSNLNNGAVNVPLATCRWGLVISAKLTANGPTVASKFIAPQLIEIPGPKGDTGTKGDTGNTGTINVGTVSAIAYGSTPTVVNSGTSTAAVFNFGLPRGEKGDAGVISSVTATSTAAGTTAAVTLGGTPSDRTIALSIPKAYNGTSRVFIEMYKWAVDEPTIKPSGTSTYTWADDTYSWPTGGSNSWTAYPGAAPGGMTLWVVRAKIVSQTVDVTTDVTWSDAVIYPISGSGPGSYTWIKYATAADGTGMTDTYSDTMKFMGIAVNKLTATESTSAAAYDWVRIRGADGIDGVSTTMYKVEPVDPILTKNAATGTLNKTQITFNSYARTGVGAFVDYAAFWRVYLDGVEVNASAASTSTKAATITSGSSYVKAIIYSDSARTIKIDEVYVPIVNEGPKGDTGTLALGTIATGAPGSTVAITNTGTASAGILNITIPRGDVGATGAVQTISIGTVTKGITAAVTRTLTGLNNSFDFVLPQGDKGDAGTISIGTVSTGAAGSNVAITNVGTASSAILNISIPKGDQGLPPTITANSTTTGTAGSSASVTLDASSTSTAAKFNFTIPKGDKGDAGNAGSITVGTVTTGNAGTNAAVSNSGTTSAAVFNFTIPRGDIGPVAAFSVGTVTTGSAGSSSAASISGTSASPVLNLTIPKGDKGDIGPNLFITSSRELAFYSVDNIYSGSGNSNITLTAVKSSDITSTSYVWSFSGFNGGNPSTSAQNAVISTSNMGTSRAATATCTIGGYSYMVTIYRMNESSAEAGATVGADWSSNVTNRPTSLSGINSTEGTLLGLFSYSGSTVTLNANFQSNANITAYYSSDERLKECVRKIYDPIGKLKSISGNNFKWAEDYYAKQDSDFVKEWDVGVLAQEVERVLPEAVRKRSDGFLAVDYAKIIPLLIEGFKAQQEIIEELRNAIQHK
jgi:hypothetical protein